jgi:uncharacterized protein
MLNANFVQARLGQPIWHNPGMKILLPLLVSVVTPLVPLLAEVELKGTPAELASHIASLPKSVTLEGEAKLTLSADRSVIRLTVATEGRTMDEASQRNQQLRDDLARALARAGVASSNIVAARFSSAPDYGKFSGKLRNVRHETSVKVTVEDEKQFQALGAFLEQRQEFRVRSIEPKDSQEEQNRLKAISLACDNAQKKRQLYEERLGLVLTPVAVHERSLTADAGKPVVGRYEESSSLSKYTVEPAARALSYAEFTFPAGFGELTYEAKVQIEFQAKRK